MSNFDEQELFEETGRMVMPGDSVIGGPNAPINKTFGVIYNRTRWLKKQVDNKVGRLGNQVIGGVKTFTESPVFNAGITISGGGSTGKIGRGENDVYIHNARTNKYLQLKDDGKLKYDGQDVLFASDTSDRVNLSSSSYLATSRAVKTAYDNSIRRGGAVGLGGGSHEIAIGWSNAGLISRVDNIVLNVGVPTGAVMYFSHAVPPFGWLKANGAAVSRVVYAELFKHIGTTYGAGDGWSTFNLPDFRGEFIRTWDDGRGVDLNRGHGSWQADEFRQHSHGVNIQKGLDTDRGQNSSTVSIDTPGETDPAGGVETRPRNIALMACIKI